MTDSKGWEWEKADKLPWLQPSGDCYNFADKWYDLGFKRILDLGAGLGRHAIYFAQRGFEVSALDLSEYAVEHLKAWRDKENQTMDVRLGDMLSLPYGDNTFDGIFAYHSISHGDTAGIKRTISEIERVLKKGGEVFASIRSKETLDFTQGTFPKIDENTILNTLEGPEKDVPHFYANRQDLIELFQNFNIESIKHIDYCYQNGKMQDRKYYYVNARKK